MKKKRKNIRTEKEKYKRITQTRRKRKCMNPPKNREMKTKKGDCQ